MRQSLLAIVISTCVAIWAITGGCAQAAENTKTTQPQQVRKFQNPPDRNTDLVVLAMSLLDTHYRPGGTHPASGLDCSGFVRYVFKEAWGTLLPRTSREMSHEGITVGPRELQPGDLVFYNTRRSKFSHVGIFVGEDKFIHSPTPGSQVRIESMSVDYWRKRFNGARRLKDSEQ